MSELISHSCALLASKEVVPPDDNRVDELLSSEPVVVDGVQFNQVKFIVDDPRHRYDGLSFNDFALNNLLAAGVDLSMQMCRPSNFSAVSALEFAAANMVVLSQKS